MKKISVACFLFLIFSSVAFSDGVPLFVYVQEECKKQYNPKLLEVQMMYSMGRISYEQYMQYQFQINQLMEQCIQTRTPKIPANSGMRTTNCRTDSFGNTNCISF